MSIPNKLQRRYTWRLYPTEQQNAAYREQAAMCADLWNGLLEICEQRYGRAVQRYGKSVTFHCADCAAASADGKIIMCKAHKVPTAFDMGMWITDLRSEMPTWRELSVNTPRRVAESVAAAYQAFFRRAKAGAGIESGKPRYKSRRHHLAIPHMAASGCKFVKSDRHLRSWELSLKGVPGTTWARNLLPATVYKYTYVDVMFRDRHWEASAAVEIEPRRVTSHGARPVVIKFDMIDGLARVNGALDMPAGMLLVQELSVEKAQMQSTFDRRWPRGKRLSDEDWRKRCDEKEAIGVLSNRIARIRRNALHVWTSKIVARAGAITVYDPKMQDQTRTPRGNKDEWGAAIKSVSEINREALSYAPSMAIQMLEYKASETGIKCIVVDDPAPAIGIGREIVNVTKLQRKVKQQIRRSVAAE